VLDFGIGNAIAANVALSVPTQGFHSESLRGGDYFLPEPGSAMRRCRSARKAAGVTEATVDSILFFQPATTSPSPFIMASKPVLATSAGSSFAALPILVSSM